MDVTAWGLSVIGSAMVAVLAAGAAYWLGRRREELQWQREDRHRFAADKRVLMAGFMTSADEWASALNRRVHADSQEPGVLVPYGPAEVPPLDAVRRRAEELDLLAPLVGASARAILDVFAEMDGHYYQHWDDGTTFDALGSYWLQLIQRYGIAKAEFVASARNDLAVAVPQVASGRRRRGPRQT